MRFVFFFNKSSHLPVFFVSRYSNRQKKKKNTECGKESKIKYSALNNNKRY